MNVEDKPNGRWRIPVLLIALVALAILARVDLPRPTMVIAALPRVLFPCAAATLALIALQWLWKPFFESSAAVKRILILGVPASAIIVVFLLPPFQGPDEIQHWKLALNYARHDAPGEAAAFSLPETLDVGAIPFHDWVKFDAQKLRTEEVRDFPAMPTEYIYIRPYSYPIVWVASLFFPRVESVHEALIFYYLCRILPLIVLTALLYYVNRKFELPLTAIVFFTLPLVMQTSLIVTADTLLNLGTIVAILLFIHVYRTRNVKVYAALWVLCLAIAYAKIITAGILLLPLVLLPFDKVPAKKFLALPAIGVVIAVGYVAVLQVIAGMRKTNILGIENCNAQLNALRTLDGWILFAKAYAHILLRSVDIRKISSPLGWLDTELSPYHMGLLILSGAAAVVFDAIRYFPSLRMILREKRKQFYLCLALIVGIFFFISLTDSLIYFIISAMPGSSYIISLQIRHLFPGIIAALLLPLMLVDRTPLIVEHPSGASMKQIVLHTSMLVTFVVLLFLRDIELAVDLLVRYW